MAYLALSLFSFVYKCVLILSILQFQLPTSVIYPQNLPSMGQSRDA